MGGTTTLSTVSRPPELRALTSRLRSRVKTDSLKETTGGEFRVDRASII